MPSQAIVPIDGPHRKLDDKELQALDLYFSVAKRNKAETGRLCGMGAKIYELFDRPWVRLERERRLEEIRERMGIDQISVLREYARIAYFDPRTLFNEYGELKRPEEWDDATAAAISSIEYGGRNEQVTKIKLASKIEALDSLAKHLELFKPENANTVNVVGDGNNFTITFVNA